MKKFNLLNMDQTKGLRDLSLRKDVSLADRARSAEFGFDYFDGTRALGYGGYFYDGRWVKVAQRAVEHFKLTSGMKVLDVGCGKGFFVYDLYSTQGIEAYGVDVSEYAVSNCHPGAVGRVHLQSMQNMSFPDNSFDAVFCINALHNLSKLEAYKAIREMNRVVNDLTKVFIQVDAFNDSNELKILENWLLTAQMYLPPDDWLNFFEKCGFEGSYFWTILNADGSVE